MSEEYVTIIGGGLAGSEAAWQLARKGIPVQLFEMRPNAMTPVHESGDLAELVCSNSLRSDDPFLPAGLLKQEMEKLDSLIITCARETSVPAGSALAVDRKRFAAEITKRVEKQPKIEIFRREITEIPDRITIVATGPLTSEKLHVHLQEITGIPLYFYDAISPVVAAESLDMDKLFFGSRYGKGGDDYLNCPMDPDTYDRFYDELISADVVLVPEFEKAIFFEGCLPIEEMARRGKETLCYGPFKPVGFIDPSTGNRPHALVQLRMEDLDSTAFSLVGCQTRMKWGEQDRVFRLFPGFEKAVFLRHGLMHRNTYINAPLTLEANLSVKGRPDLFLAGQLTGVEGYIESAATGLLAGLNLSRTLKGLTELPPPPQTALGGLVRHLTQSDPKHYKPSNINFGLIEKGSRKRKRETAERAVKAIDAWISQLSTE